MKRMGRPPKNLPTKRELLIRSKMVEVEWQAKKLQREGREEEAADLMAEWRALFEQIRPSKKKEVR